MFQIDAELEPRMDLDAEIEGAEINLGGTTDHRELTGRDAPDQHPISSVTGLSDALDEKQSIKPYLSLSRLSRYLYEVTFEDIPADIGANSVLGLCSSYVKDGKLYRNLDINYNHNASFHVILPNMEGVSVISGLTDTNLDDILIGQLPYHMTDGKNEHDIMVSTHLLFNDWEWSGRGSIPLTKIPYLVLKNVSSMETIQDDLADILDDLYAPSIMVEHEYLMQVLVTDGTTTYVLSPKTDGSNAYELVDISENPKLTNFLWVPDTTVVRTDLQTRPTGVERWNLMPCELENLRFTKAYETPSRLSEFIGIDDTTKDSTDAELTDIYNRAHAAYEDRTRDGATWQTMHSVVYSASGMEHLWVQENWERDHAGAVDLTAYRTAANQDEIDAGKLTEPSTGLAVGKYFRIAEIDENGHAVLEAVDEPSVPVLTGTSAPTGSTVGQIGQLYIINTSYSVRQPVYICSRIANGTYSWAPLFTNVEGQGTNGNAINLTITRTSGSYNGVCVGAHATTGTNGISIGADASSSAGSLAIGTSANANGANSIQLMSGTSAANMFQVSNKPLLNISTGLIPFERMNNVKTAMDSVAVAGATYLLSEQTDVTVSLPSDALAGQTITVVFYSGATAATLTVSGDVIGDVPVPTANQRVEMSFLFDGVMWDLLTNVTDVTLEGA